LKACREAKEETSWTSPNHAYEQAPTEFVARLFEDRGFVEEVRGFCDQVAPYAAVNGLAQCVLRLTSPGVCDTYQGTELWNQSYVDPDNRRPVDFKLRAEWLRSLRQAREEPLARCKRLLERYHDGNIKLYVTHTLLNLRKQHRSLFLRSAYEGLPAHDHVVAFTRCFEAERLLCVVPRFTRRRTQGAVPFALGDAWAGDTLRVPHPGRYRNVFTEQVV